MKIKKPLRIVKSVRTSEAEFKNDISEFLSIQKNRFNRSGILQEVYEKYPIAKEYVEKYLDRKFDFRDEYLYNVIEKHYKAEYNLTRIKQGENPLADIPLRDKRRLMEIAKNINNYTKKQLSGKIHKSMKSKHTINKARAEVKGMMTNMEDYRAERIYKTEMARARSEAFMDLMKSLGLRRKKWIDACGEGCQICKSNERIGWIPMNAKFPSGDKNTPQHPSCDCVVVGGK